MKRRNFFFTAGLGSMGLYFNPGFCLINEIQTAGDINKFLRSIIPVGEPSVDRIIIGNPDTKIKKVGTVWMPYFETLLQAVSQGINILIVHEPTFYDHWDLDSKNI